MTVIQIHNNEYLQKERVMLEYPVVLKDKPAYNKLKRIGDVIGSVGALVVLSPVFLATTLAILIDDFGNPFYSQVRIGKNGKPFEIYKFRSMYKNADQRREELLRKNESKGANFKIKNDPRITRVGAILRKTSIEPQLVNILKGDMSFVGPRPFIPAEQKNLAPDRLLVKPGLSCYWQIGGKNELSEAEQIALDRKYIQERSIKTDIKIIFKTILHVLSGKNC
ncbi:MAG: sugar transferase [Oscillospiraceae bacterium]|nr:sugar transferase [Oscillospiraceae bacterium]